MDKFTHMHTHKHTYMHKHIHIHSFICTFIYTFFRESLQNMLPAHLGLGVVKQRAEELAFIENKSKEKFCEKLVEII